MLNSDAFSYVNILDKTLDASWTRQTAIANNLANVDTPTYKRKDVEFKNILESELSSPKYRSLDQAVRHADLDALDAKVYTDHANFSYRIGKITANAQLDAAAYPYDYRLDGNNVDPQTENVELASEQLRYQELTQSLRSQFSRFTTAAKSS